MSDTAARALVLTCLAGAVVLGSAAPALAATVEIKLVQTPDGRTYFDPSGVHIVAGDTVRLVQVSVFHSITA
jgi:plastocyanin